MSVAGSRQPRPCRGRGRAAFPAEQLEAADADEVKGDETEAEAAGLLATIVDQDVQVDGEHLAIREGVPGWVISHSEREIRHGRKSASSRFDGVTI